MAPFVMACDPCGACQSGVGRGPWPWGFDPVTGLRMSEYGDCSFDPWVPIQILQTIYDEARATLSSGTFLLSMEAITRM